MATTPRGYPLQADSDAADLPGALNPALTAIDSDVQSIDSALDDLSTLVADEATLWAGVTAAVTVTGNSWSPQAPSVTISRAGVYMVRWGAGVISTNAGASCEIRVGVGSPGSPSSVMTAYAIPGSTAAVIPVAMSERMTLAAGNVLRQFVRSGSVGVQASFQQRFIEATLIQPS